GLIREHAHGPDDQRGEKPENGRLRNVVAKYVVDQLRDPYHRQHGSQRYEHLQRVEEDDRPEDEKREVICMTRTDRRIAQPLVIVDGYVFHRMVVADGGQRDGRRERESRWQQILVALDEALA